MPRNDQITRQWQLLRRLEGSNGLFLQQLVESIPEDFPKNARTVRRGLEALEAGDFPLVTEQVTGQTCWRLNDSIFHVAGLGLPDLKSAALGERYVTR